MTPYRYVVFVFGGLFTVIGIVLITVTAADGSGAEAEETEE